MSLLLSRRITSFGNITVEDFGLTTLSPSHAPVQKHRVKWTPPLSVAGNLPPAFSLFFHCYVGDDGVRRFSPACGRQVHIAESFLAGLAVLQRIKGLDSESLNSYRAMWLVFGLVRSMKEHNGRAFKTSRDLYVRVSGRGEKGGRSLLPEDVGLDLSGNGRAWSIGHLLERGRQAAREVGIANPTSAIAIPYGLFEAAKLNPLAVDRDQILPLVRTALFQIDSRTAALARTFVEMTAERLLTAVHRHLEDTADDFNAWFSGPKSSLLKLLSAKPDEHGNAVNREDVRQAVLLLGWESYQYVSACIHAALRWVENALELTDDEKGPFEHAFLPQPYFGGLPLVLLAERSDFLRPAVTRIWETPDDLILVRVLHRLLYYYGHLAEGRRDADRRFKEKRASTGARSVLGKNVDLPNSLQETPAAVTCYGDVAEKVRESHHLNCGCGWGEYEAYIRPKAGDTGRDCVEFSFHCRCGRAIGSVVVRPVELVLLARGPATRASRPE